MSDETKTDEGPRPLADDTREWTEADYREAFGSRAKCFNRGYASGRADANAQVIRALRTVCAVLERELAEDAAIAAGDELPRSH